MKKEVLEMYGTKIYVFKYEGNINDSRTIEEAPHSPYQEIGNLQLSFSNNLTAMRSILNVYHPIENLNRKVENLLGIGYKQTEDGTVEESYEVVAENIDRKQLANLFISFGATVAMATVESFTDLIIKDKVPAEDISEEHITLGDAAGSEDAGRIVASTINVDHIVADKKKKRR